MALRYHITDSTRETMEEAERLGYMGHLTDAEKNAFYFLIGEDYSDHLKAAREDKEITDSLVNIRIGEKEDLKPGFANEILLHSMLYLELQLAKDVIVGRENEESLNQILTGNLGKFVDHFTDEEVDNTITLMFLKRYDKEAHRKANARAMEHQYKRRFNRGGMLETEEPEPRISEIELKTYRYAAGVDDFSAIPIPTDRNQVNYGEAGVPEYDGTSLFDYLANFSIMRNLMDKYPDYKNKTANEMKQKMFENEDLRKNLAEAIKARAGEFNLEDIEEDTPEMQLILKDAYVEAEGKTRAANIPGEKELRENIEKSYKLLDKSDSIVTRSSRQFKEYKNSMKDLQKLIQSIPQGKLGEPENQEKLNEAIKRSQELGQDYLKYKIDADQRKSGTRALRIAAVEECMSSVKAIDISRQKDTFVHMEPTQATVTAEQTAPERQATATAGPTRQ